MSTSGFFNKRATIIDRYTELLAEKRNRSGVAVQVTGVADRTYLTVAEKSCARHRPEYVCECAGIMIWDFEKMSAPSVA